MRTKTYVSTLPKCNFHPEVDAHYDAMIPGMSWAYLCNECFHRFGCTLGTGKGQKLLLEEKKPIRRPPSIEELMQQEADGLVEAACEYGCMVEPDGYCEHRKPSWLLKLGLL